MNEILMQFSNSIQQILGAMTSSYHTVSKSLFTYHPTIPSYIISATGSTVQ